MIIQFKYWPVFLFISCLCSIGLFGQNHSDSLQRYLKQGKYLEGIWYAERNVSNENASNKNFDGEVIFLVGELFEKYNQFNNAYDIYGFSLKDNSLKKGYRKKAMKFISRHEQDYNVMKLLYSMAMDAYSKNDTTSAKNYIRDALNKDGKYKPALEFKLLIETLGSNSDSVWHYYKMNTEINPYRTATYIQTGQFYESRFDYEIAIKVYNELLLLNRAYGLFGIAGVYFKQGQFIKAIEYYKGSYELIKNKVAMFNIGLCYKELNNYNLAINVFLKLRKEISENGRIDEELGYCYYTLDNYDKAIEYYSSVIEKDPKNAGAYYSMGYSYYYRENEARWGDKKTGVFNDSMYVKAFECVSKAVDVEPTNAKYHYGKAEVLTYFNSREKRQNECLKYIGEAIALDSNNYFYWEEYLDMFLNSDVTIKDRKKFGLKAVNHFKSLLNDPDIDKAKTLFAISELFSAWAGAMIFDKERSGAALYDSTFFYRKAAFLFDAANKKYLEDPLFWQKVAFYIKVDTAICFEYLKKNPSDFRVWHQFFVESWNNKDYKTADLLYVQINGTFPESDLAKAINYEVRKLKKRNKFRWSDICEKQTCYYFDKFTSVDFFEGQGPYPLISD
ncbi:MAG: tetratricopeptide repeat protein [Bacteroidetes bacterium]|nr:tetratricopeptide repeat protein [Bacteroidota bacterium]